MEPGHLEQVELEVFWDGQDVGWESNESAVCLSVKVGEGQHFEDKLFAAATTELHDGEEERLVGMVPFGVSVCGPHWVCGDASDDECAKDPDGKWMVVERWNVVDVVEECDVGIEVNVDDENGGENVEESVNVEVAEVVLKDDGIVSEVFGE